MARNRSKSTANPTRKSLGATPRSVRRTAEAAPEDSQRLRFSAVIPGAGDTSLFRITVEAHSEPDAGGGERLRLRAHVQANFASGLKPALAFVAQRATARALAALPNPNTREDRHSASAITLALAPFARRAGGWLERRLQAQAPRLLAAAAPLLTHDLQSWFELHASTAPLAQGARALLPEIAKLGVLGIKPSVDANAPPLEQWMGRIDNEVAQVTMLRLDERQLPDGVRELLGGRPFQLAAAVVNVVTRKG